MIIDDPAHVRSQYLTEDNLETRRSVWHPTADGRDPTTEALDAIVAEQPLRVLEVGPGTGGFAARVAAALPGVRLTAIDQSARFVELTRARGIDAREGDVQDLPFGDEAFDVVAALWMLYHVPDVDRALAEVRRVLRPGGLFVAVTNGDGHLADLRVEAGGRPGGDRGSAARTARSSCAPTSARCGAPTSGRAPCSPTARVAEAYLALVRRGRRLAGAVVRRAARVRRRGDDLLLPLTATQPLTHPGSVVGQRRLPGRPTPFVTVSAVGRRGSGGGEHRLLGDRLRDVAGQVGRGGADEQRALLQAGEPDRPRRPSRSGRRRRPWPASRPWPWSRP